MKKLYFLSIALFSTISIPAQVNSINGYNLPTKGTYRILSIYVQIDSSNCGGAVINPTEWPNGSDPLWETGNDPNPMARPMFDADFTGLENITSGTLTDYYFQASHGELIMLGDYISLTIPCDWVDPIHPSYSIANET